ncbi:Gag-Pol polyprotein [Gossypium australe]|uniref:Gag-Pol polyprotein n=1 Tax=Gossypium australe TaxID=47621 RepID=A0A5B6WPD6_9ROSI|nr:Gag-Pol polyprotein [Gossypium australe]
MSFNQARAKSKEAETASQASVQQATNSSRRLELEGRGEHDKGTETVRTGKALVDKIRKYGAEEFSATIEDDLERAEFWLKNTIRGNITVSEYEREFVRLSQYAQEWVRTEVEMCKRFKEVLNENIKLLVSILEIREFAALADQAKKAEELSKEKKQANREARKSQSSVSKKSKRYQDRFTTSAGYSGKEQGFQRSNPWPPSPSMTSVGGVGNTKPKCKHCNKFHYGECRLKSGVCYRCGSFDHFLRYCPERFERGAEQTSKPNNPNPVSRGGRPRHPGNASAKSEARAPARTYAIRAREDASAPDVITGTFSLLDTDITSLIDIGSTHSYICTNLVAVKNLPIEFTEFVVEVSNPLGQCVMVDKICKYCQLMVKDGELLYVESDKLDGLSNVISAVSAQKCIRKRYDAYLAYVLDTKVTESKIQLVPVVCEFLDVFPKELPNLPPCSKLVKVGDRSEQSSHCQLLDFGINVNLILV